MSETLSFPPLMSGLETGPGEAPYDAAIRQAALGVDAGLITYQLDANTLRAALVLAPEVPLSKGIAMLPLVQVGLQNALGALAPPEVAVHFEWSGAMRINGARCGHFCATASTDDPDAQPDWLVVGFELPLWPASDNPGDTPDETALYAEGCSDVAAPQLLESWARHTLNWIMRWESEGPQALHSEWRGLAHGLGEPLDIMGRSGTFLGLDEDFGMLLRGSSGETELIPLTQLLEG